MASSLISGIYPPLVTTYNPTFVNSDSTFRIYFSDSPVNNIKELHEVHVVISDGRTNESIVKDVSRIIVCPFNSKNNLDSTIETDYKYYVTIKKSDLIEGGLVPEKVYKAQLRFSKVTFDKNKYGNRYLKYFTENKLEFSEWSVLTLIRSIYKPKWDIEKLNVSSLNTINDNFVPFCGTFNYDTNNQVTDYLVTYKLSLMSGGDVIDEIVREDVNQRVLKTNGSNDGGIPINEYFYYLLDDGNQYTIKLEYKTAYGYEETLYYDFIYELKINNDLNDISINVVVTKQPEGSFRVVPERPDDPNGRIFVEINAGATDSMGSEEANVYNKIIYIYRTDASSNFKKYDIVHRIRILKGYSFNYTFCDKTAESGIFYQYAARQKMQADENDHEWGDTVFTEKPVMQFLEDMFLVGDNRQLKISLDPQVNTFGYQVREAVTDTIGGKYPVINRGGKKEYRKFNISGMICSIENILNEESITDGTQEIKTIYSDRGESLFASREDIYGVLGQPLYDDYNAKANINYWNDINFERFFREDVLNFLYDGNVKLYKSATEGNIMVRLTGISLQSNQTLGRMLYSFSATAIEVMDYTIENCDIYNVQNINYKMKSDIVLHADKVHNKIVYNPDYQGQKGNDIALVFKEKVTIELDEAGDIL